MRIKSSLLTILAVLAEISAVPMVYVMVTALDSNTSDG